MSALNLMIRAWTTTNHAPRSYFKAIRMMSGGGDCVGTPGQGAGHGGGAGGSIRDAGGSFGKREAALEEQERDVKEKRQCKLYIFNRIFTLPIFFLPNRHSSVLLGSPKIRGTVPTFQEKALQKILTADRRILNKSVKCRIEIVLFSWCGSFSGTNKRSS